MKNFGKLMQQAQEMQGKMTEMQEKLAEMEVEGSSGGGMVRVTLTGKGELRRVQIDPDTLKPEDKEVVEDLLVAAHADAKQKVEAKVQEEMQNLTGGMGLPEGFKMPF
jgi:hypothetical protein